MVAFSFMKWRVQPLMKWEHLRYEYIGAEDELRLSQEELMVLRLQKIFQGLTGIPAVAVREFSADNPPKQVTNRDHSPRVLIMKIVVS
jgi:hypothetical protein